MLVALSSSSVKRSVVIASLGVCVLGTLIAALRAYYSGSKKRKAPRGADGTTKEDGGARRLRSSRPGSVVGGRAALTPALRRSNSSSSRRSSATHRSMAASSRKERLLLIASKIHGHDSDNLPAEELLELGLEYLKQAIKSWETALDSIENAVYMQSSTTLALPTDEHADVVYNLRRLLDEASNINTAGCSKLVKSSQTLQIIQSRLAFKQQLYSDALMKNTGRKTSEICENDEEDAAANQGEEEITAAETETFQKILRSPSLKRFLSEDDNDSFVSAESDVDWVDEDLMRRFEFIEPSADKNLLYEMGMSNVNLGRVSYRVSRTVLLGCKSDEDFATKLYVIRLGFDRFLQNGEKKAWFIQEGRTLVSKLMAKARKDPAGMHKTYDEMVSFVMDGANLKAIQDELKTRDVNCFNFYDVALDFILLDAFEDLESPPSAVTAVIKNNWLSQSFKETALSAACWSVLKAKRKYLKYPDGFMSRFYSINEHLAPVLAWGFLGTDAELTASCMQMKSKLVEYLQCLFDINQTRYTTLEDLVSDIDSHSIRYLNEILKCF